MIFIDNVIIWVLNHLILNKTYLKNPFNINFTKVQIHINFYLKNCDNIFVHYSVLSPPSLCVVQYFHHHALCIEFPSTYIL